MVHKVGVIVLRSHRGRWELADLDIIHSNYIDLYVV